MEDDKPWQIKLSTGHVLDPNGGYVGINQNLAVTQGYDGDFTDPYIELSDWQREDEDIEWEELTPAERVELGDIMIARWQSFVDRHKAKFPRGGEQ